MFVCCEYSVLSGRGLSDERVARAAEFTGCGVLFRNLKNEEAMARLGQQRHGEEKLLLASNGKQALPYCTQLPWDGLS
jgi:hypothetical protein